MSKLMIGIYKRWLEAKADYKEKVNNLHALINKKMLKMVNQVIKTFIYLENN